MLPNIVFQIPQPSLIVIYQSLNIFPLREGHQIAVPSFMKADDSGKPCHLGHFQQGETYYSGDLCVEFKSCLNDFEIQFE